MNDFILQNVDPKMLRTEERIIFAGLKVFSQYPLEVATLRQIADEAGCTLSLITYHFKTKDALYTEVLNRAINYVIEILRKQAGILDSLKEIPPEKAKEMLYELVASFAERIFANPNARFIGQIIMREHFSPSPAYDILYESTFKKMIDALSRLIGIVTGEKDKEKNALQAFSVFGQVISALIEREMMIRYLGYQGFSEEESIKLKEMILGNISRQLEL